MSDWNILVVDDDPSVLQLFTDVLMPIGCKVHTCLDGKAASVIYRSTRIDLSIIDLLMPEQDGIETLKDIRSMTPDAKVIVFSAASEFLSLMEDFGADRTLSKPLDRKKIIESVEGLLSC